MKKVSVEEFVAWLIKQPLQYVEDSQNSIILCLNVDYKIIGKVLGKDKAESRYYIAY